MKFHDKNTGFFLADPDKNPFPNGIPLPEDIRTAAQSLILSASGWRKIFASDEDEESITEKISEPDKIIAGIMALSFSVFIKEKSEKKHPLILIGMDCRYTGPAICDVMARVFLSEGVKLRNLFITAAPEIMAYSAVSEDVDGFAYISASHNPVGHNGLKFGTGGGVIGGEESSLLITYFRNLLNSPDIAERIFNLIDKTDTDTYSKVLKESAGWKSAASDAYLSFSRLVISDTDDPEEQNLFFSRLKNSAKQKPVGVIGELNGSARSLSIDRKILSSSGIEIITFNDNPREIVHRIVPEGFSLDDCRRILEKQYTQNKAYILGYVPDNDGDRGNIVYINEKQKKAEILEAQEVFALAVLGELAYASMKKHSTRLAVAVNGPTSMRIDRISEAFGAETFRAEVGEANVVSLAEQLRGKKYKVRILGEGSNGGNITHPAAVRDPINTIFSILKILLFKDPFSNEDIFKIWCRKSDQTDKYHSHYTLSDIIDTLPRFITTNAYEDRAIMKIKTLDHGLLKARYEKIFQKEWKEKKNYIQNRFNIHNWREINYEGTESREGFGPEYRSGQEKGGLKIAFSNIDGKDTDYIWMRGSGTEPVFRILADCEGEDKAREEWFLNWHRTIIEKADKGV